MADAFQYYGPISERLQASTVREWFENLPASSNPDFCVFFNDFLTAQEYAAADWVITTTEAGGGDATEALAADELYGALKITNDSNNDDSDSLQINEETFKLTPGKQLWYETRCKLADADISPSMIGLSITDTSPTSSSDRIAFHSDDDNASIFIRCAKDSTQTSVDTQVDYADDTYVRLGFYYNGYGQVKAFVNRVLKSTITTNIPDDENLCITVRVQNGAAAAKSITVDYIYVCAER